MRYVEWRDEVEKELLTAGFQRDYAGEKARSVRGLFHSENDFPSPLAIAKKLIESCKTGLAFEEAYKAYCKKHNIKRKWLQQE
jgi:hypothetical protein